jgi:tRNA (mo5U34)-methyltransferase
MAFSKDELEQLSQSQVWFHSIDLGHGVITKGQKTPQALEWEVAALRLPDLRDKTVLDIGCFDGFYSFEAERRGASRVVALDHYVWEYEAGFTPEYFAECERCGSPPELPYKTEWLCWEWRPEELPGKRRFDLAHRALNSKVEPRVADFMKVAPGDIGIFNVIFFLGVLYHMENPLEAMRRVAAMTNDMAIIETEAVLVPGYEDHAICEFFESNELNGDYSNWWSPNEKAVQGLCRAAGFQRVETIQGPPAEVPAQTKPGVIRYRAILHAWK